MSFFFQRCPFFRQDVFLFYPDVPPPQRHLSFLNFFILSLSVTPPPFSFLLSFLLISFLFIYFLPFTTLLILSVTNGNGVFNVPAPSLNRVYLLNFTQIVWDDNANFCKGFKTQEISLKKCSIFSLNKEWLYLAKYIKINANKLQRTYLNNFLYYFNKLFKLIC